jgi:DNA-binding PucR family transcriptional regulator
MSSYDRTVDATLLRDLLPALGEPLVEVVAGTRGLDVPVTGIAVVDPDDEADDHTGRLVLVIGARGGAAAPAVREVARRGAAAVAVKVDREPGTGAALRTAAGAATLLAVRADARWDHVAQAVRDALAGTDTGPGALYSLAQTVALLTGGLVSIEDTASRVLAYSRTDERTPGHEADELRRLSILGWQGPPDYLRLLREWGVFDRLRRGEEVVDVEAHAELGIRRRLAVGVHAGARQLGTIWVQEGARPLAERSREVLVGAARVAAGHLARQRQRPGPDLVAGLLDGRVSAELAAAALGLDPARPVVVAAFALRGAAGSARAFGVAELADVVSVHAAAYRRDALTTSDGARVHAVLPGVPPDRVEPGLRAFCAEVAAMAHRRTGARVQVGIGAPAPGLAGAPASRAEAERVLAAMAPVTDVAALADLRAEILLDGVLDLLAAADGLRDPAVDRLVAHDAEHGTELARSVLAHLDALGDVRAAAARLTVHPNTLRYRLRRAAAVAGLALGDPRARLVHHLHLLLAVRPTAQRPGTEPVRTDDPSATARS